MCHAGDGVAAADVAPADVAPADDGGHPDSERYPTDEPVRLVPASVAQCRCHARFATILEWLRLHVLANLRIASFSGRRIKIVAWGVDARLAVSAALNPCRQSHAWLKRLQLDEAEKEFPHPNAVSYASNETAISTHLSSLVNVVKFVSGGSFRRTKEFKARVKEAYPPYDAQRFRQRSVVSIGQVRPLLIGILERICRATNWIRGTADSENPNVGSLDVVDLRWRLNKLLLSLHLRSEATNDAFLSKLKTLPTVIAAAHPPRPSVAASASIGGQPEMQVEPDAKLSKLARKDFLRRCYDEASRAAGLPNVERFALLERFHVDQQSPQWKKKLATSFQRAVQAALKALGDGAALQLSKCPPQDLLNMAIVDGAAQPDAEMRFDLEELKKLVETKAKPTPVAATAVGKTATRGHFFLKPAGEWKFFPKQPVVKVVPEFGYGIGHFSVSRRVGAELMVHALRDVVTDANLALLKVNRETAVALLSAAVQAAFVQQRGHFQKRGNTGVEGRMDKLEEGLSKAFEMEWSKDGTLKYTVEAQTIGSDKKYDKSSKALFLALYDWKRVVHPRHGGKLAASTDGVGLNLLALPKKPQKGSASAAAAAQKTVSESRNAAADVGNVSICGVDYGKSSAVAMIPPVFVQRALHAKAAAEASLARLQDTRGALVKCAKCG